MSIKEQLVEDIIGEISSEEAILKIMKSYIENSDDSSIKTMISKTKELFDVSVMNRFEDNCQRTLTEINKIIKTGERIKYEDMVRGKQYLCFNASSQLPDIHGIYYFHINHVGESHVGIVYLENAELNNMIKHNYRRIAPYSTLYRSHMYNDIIYEVI